MQDAAAPRPFGPDPTLVATARAGDRDAFGRIVGLVTDRCYAVAHRILRDPGLAEDAVQEALVSAWRQLHRLREPERFDAWLWRILVNACYVQSRRSRHIRTEVRVLPTDLAARRDEAATVVQRDALERAFRRLPIEQRVVFVLHHHAGIPLVEIAASLGIPDGTARSRLHYATRALREQLADPLAAEEPA